MSSRAGLLAESAVCSPDDGVVGHIPLDAPGLGNDGMAQITVWALCAPQASIQCIITRAGCVTYAC